MKSGVNDLNKKMKQNQTDKKPVVVANKKTVLIFVGFYLPGYKAGGPIQSIAGIINALGDDFDFWVVTKDRDSGDTETYPGIIPDNWNAVVKAKVFYLKNGQLSFLRLKSIVKKVNPEIIYLNGFFNNYSLKTLLLKKIFGLGKAKIILAPRGELSEGALNLKRIKKKLFLIFAKATSLFKDVIFHASTSKEKTEIKQYWSANCEIRVAANLPAITPLEPDEILVNQRVGSVKFLYVSRINPKKNLKYLIDCISNINGNCVLTIAGYIDDENYWLECKKKIESLNSNIKVKILGPVEHEDILKLYKSHHFFVLPTFGENFGHVIFEALACGCPVLISDTTPWSKLESHRAGWAIPLNEKQNWIKTLKLCAKMNHTEHTKMSANACLYAKNWLKVSDHIRDNYLLFNED